MPAWLFAPTVPSGNKWLNGVHIYLTRSVVFGRVYILYSEGNGSNSGGASLRN